VTYFKVCGVHIWTRHRVQVFAFPGANPRNQTGAEFYNVTIKNLPLRLAKHRSAVLQKATSTIGPPIAYIRFEPEYQALSHRVGALKWTQFVR
jgi:hypothetical protein